MALYVGPVPKSTLRVLSKKIAIQSTCTHSEEYLCSFTLKYKIRLVILCDISFKKTQLLKCDVNLAIEASHYTIQRLHCWPNSLQVIKS